MGLCLVISSHNPPSEAVVHWLAGRPGGPTACAGPLIRQRSGPGCHLGCSGRSSSRLPGKRPRRFPPWAQRGKCESRDVRDVREPGVLQPLTLTFLHWLPETADLWNATHIIRPPTPDAAITKSPPRSVPLTILLSKLLGLLVRDVSLGLQVGLVSYQDDHL